MKNNKKIWTIVSCLMITLIILHYLALTITYFSIFNKVPVKDYQVSPGLNYEEIQNDYNIKYISFKSKNNILQGYYLKNDSAKGLVVMSHGFKDGADSLISSQLFFLENGYSVFAFDNSGFNLSSGKINGFSQSLIDLESALTFLNTNNDFKNYKKLLFGFSCGAYASCAIFNLNVLNIYGSVSISGFNDASNLIFNKGKEYVGLLAYLGKDFINLIQTNKFKEYSNYLAIDGINTTTLPFFIIHSLKDKTITYDTCSILSLKNKINNQNVFTYLDKENDHSSLIYSDEAKDYQKNINSSLKKIKSKQEKIQFVKNVNDYKYCEVNYYLYSNILSFYDYCLK